MLSDCLSLLLLTAVGTIGIESMQRVRCINYRRRCICVPNFFLQGVEQRREAWRHVCGRKGSGHRGGDVGRADWREVDEAFCAGCDGCSERGRLVLLFWFRSRCRDGSGRGGEGVGFFVVIDAADIFGG